MLNKSYAFRGALKPLLLLLCAMAAFSSCGKRRPPLPPVERVFQRAEISGKQIGDRVDIVWKMPARNAADGSTLKITRVDIFRLAEKLTDSLSLTESEFASRSTLIGSIPITEADFALKEKVFSDKLQIVGQEARLRYSIRFANREGQKASFSNFFLIEPVQNVARSPVDIVSTVTQDAIIVSWSPPTSNMDGSEPANVVGYNVFKVFENSVPRLLNPKPLDNPRFVDEDFEFGTKIRYFVRTVSLGRNAEPVESFSSETIEALPLDTFAPAPPDALTIASAPGVISVFFAFNLEKDIAGYKVFRSTDRTLPLGRWDLLTPDAIESNTFQDKSAKAGITYYYFVVAIDLAGNTSEPSEIVDEASL